MNKLTKQLLTPILLIGLSIGNAWAENVKIEMLTSHGSIKLELDREKAPKTVDNFVQYARDGFYDGTVFHRVIKNFMIQGGGFTADMKKKETREPIQNEAKNGLKNKRGTIAMARTSAPHSATAQFFINHRDNNSLDYPSRDGWGYAVFGKVTSGMEVVDAIAGEMTGTKNGMRNVPKTSVLIEKVTVLE
ncbi:MAG: peptidyl-prolyl cis-trans isomerase [Candidatus Thiodiazotropha sp. (ex Monitilora ramsayi)]|nr:peptidyl-prolyl cis-trans isomerase [Candidatus Thiodiazotropha sp. (ex Monitilora ramsayi)]